MEPIVNHRGEGRATWMLNGLVVTKALRSETGGAYGLTENIVTPQSVPPMHIHSDEEEAFYILEGELEFVLDGEKVHAGPGSYTMIPRGVAHAFRVLTDSARMLVIASAAGGEPTNGGLASFYDMIGEPAPAHVLPEPSDPNPAELIPAATHHGITILPPSKPER